MNISNNPTLGFIMAVAAIGGVILGGVALSSSVSSKKAVDELAGRMDREMGGVADVQNQVSALSGRVQGSLDELRQNVAVMHGQVSNLMTRAAGPAKAEPKKTDKVGKAEPEVTGPGTYHTIAAGDILGRVAKQNGTTVEAIQKLNPGVDASHLKIGQKIRVK